MKNLLLAVVLAGCAPPFVRDGFELDAHYWQVVEQAILSRATFELSCDASQLKLRVLGTFKGVAVANLVGVEGCGKKVVYVRPPGRGTTWVMNSASGMGDSR